LTAGRLLPRYPSGHIILSFWNEKDGLANPGNLDTPEKLKAMFTDALQDGDPSAKRKDIIFYDDAVHKFLKKRPGRSHYMKVNRFHDDSVALVGDAAHGMSTLLGQGCATGLKYTEVLAEELSSEESRELNHALECYSKRAVRGAHAITDLNLVATSIIRGGPLLKAFFFPFFLLQKVLGITIFQRLHDIDVSYEKILNENWFLIPISRLRWRKERVPFRGKSN
jgi:2-polyprenyl-6-methoxyphenol hydroxylase-like FAD-dependent oxidoreductase